MTDKMFNRLLRLKQTTICVRMLDMDIRINERKGMLWVIARDLITGYTTETSYNKLVLLSVITDYLQGQFGRKFT